MKQGQKFCADCGVEIPRVGSKVRCDNCQTKCRAKQVEAYKQAYVPVVTTKICDICGVEFVSRSSRHRVCDSVECQRAAYLARREKSYGIHREKMIAKATALGKLDEYLVRAKKHRECNRPWNGKREQVPERASSRRIVARHLTYLQGDKFARRANDLIGQYFDGVSE